MKYDLLTVTDKDSVIKGFDCIVAENNQYEMRESRLTGFGEIATTVYDQDEYEDFIPQIDLTSNTTKQIKNYKSDIQKFNV